MCLDTVKVLLCTQFDSDFFTNKNNKIDQYYETNIKTMIFKKNLTNPPTHRWR